MLDPTFAKESKNKKKSFKAIGSVLRKLRVIFENVVKTEKIGQKMEIFVDLVNLKLSRLQIFGIVSVFLSNS